jgi:zinc transporter 7
LISVLPTVVLFAIPFEKGHQPIPFRLHKFLLAFAGGGLLGDVFLHTIPHLLGGHHHGDHSHNEGHDHSHNEGHDHHHHDEHDHHPHDHSHGHDSHNHDHGLNVGLYILLGFAFFFLFEKLIRTSHNHNSTTNKPKKSDTPPSSSSNGQSFLFKLTSKIDSGGLLNLAADSLHNFTDGVAIGASFVGGKGLGIAVFLSILAHELPHEIGDFAILVKNGCTAREAIMLQFCTAFFAFVGTGVGLISTHFEEMNELLLALVSGGFVYLATMTVMPELFQDSPGKQSTSSSQMMQTLIELGGFGAGVLMMVIVAKLEVHDH